jgi:uncharacterized protein YbjT (DUF2867 family)
VARILIVGGGCQGLALGRELVQAGHAVRVTTRTPARRGAIEHRGAECWIGTPDRLATLRGALDGVTLACWLLARVRGERGQLQALHGPRLEAFMRQLIDTTVRGVVYDASAGVLPAQLLAEGAAVVRELAAFNSIPARVLSLEAGTVSADRSIWLTTARGAVAELLEGRG